MATLFVHLDAGNTSSYPGTGTAWYDLSGNSKTGTLNDGVTFDSVNKTMSFPGTASNRVSLTGNGNNYFKTTFSIEMWFRSSGLGAGMTVGGLFGFTYGLRSHINNGSLVFGVDDTSIPDLIYLNTSNYNFFDNNWRHVIWSNSGSYSYIYINGVLNASRVSNWNGTTRWPTDGVNIGIDNNDWSLYALKGNITIFKYYDGVLTPQEILNNFNSTKHRFLVNTDKSIYHSGKSSDYGSLPSGDDSSISLNTWPRFQRLLMRSVEAGNLSINDVVSTYSLVYTAADKCQSAVIASNGDIHFIPFAGVVGQKLSSSGVISTYSLVYTNSAGYHGGVLAPNGDIHFVPHAAIVGQKISASGVVSTYSLVHSNADGGYVGGCLAPNGDVHFFPYMAKVGQKISMSGIVSTYSLVYTSGYYIGGVLSPNGEIHFVPYTAAVGQKVSVTGVVSTYSLVYTSSGSYNSAVVASNGDIHFISGGAVVGQKISILGVVSTYSLIIYGNWSYYGAVLAPNGDIHMINWAGAYGQKISSLGIVSTYTLVYTNGSGAYAGGVLDEKGNIHFSPRGAAVGQKISTQSAIPFSLGVCCSPFFNKF